MATQSSGIGWPEWPEWQKDLIRHGGEVRGIGFMDRLRILILGRFTFETTIATEEIPGRVEGTTTVHIPGLFDRWRKQEPPMAMAYTGEREE